jgi:glycosyltransferase involved in cell wall biosynthesis
MSLTKPQKLNRLKVKGALKTKTSNSNFLVNTSNEVYDMIVFSHFRWDFVYHRPQHIMSRMAHDFKILFIEEPLPKADKGNPIKFISNNLHVLQPNIVDMNDLPQVLSAIIGKDAQPIGWFCAPSFSGVLNEFNFSTVVYDCMDELSLSKRASSELPGQEMFLLQKSTVVFTRGKALFEAKLLLHNNVFCFPCSVDVEHFKQTTIGIPDKMVYIKPPIIGFIGILDERMDLLLIEETARFLPEYSFVFVGPVVGIPEEDIPRSPNIHYLGIQPYSDLSHYLNAFDIAMIPFAINGSTKYVSPAITLEYMAAGKPIISTRVSDVERDYSGCVRLINDSSEFASEIQKILKKEIKPKVYLYNAILNKTSWDRTVNRMKAIINQYVKN